ncbi:MAG TPA: pyridoxamine 5'-phosphate oxidase family protein [Candidatus Methylomirabilis sp.]|nr:pyridoxamine 5'-phosphate oxidase family protein [Candidatus Methylomirabilis sp.]
MNDLTPTPRSQVRRIPERGHYDFETIASILDAGLLCFVGYSVNGKPYVTPTAYWRTGNHVYWHGSSASRMLRTLETGVDVCLTVAHMDGLVLARSAFHHSINYRSVMLFGTAHKLAEESAKAQALEAFVERLFPGRWTELRPVTSQELKATTVLRMAIEESSAKVRTGPPKDDEEDYTWPVWAGVLPIQATLGAPIPDPRLPETIQGPKYLSHLAHFDLHHR